MRAPGLFLVVLLAGCGLDEYRPDVTVVRDGGDSSSTGGDTTAGDPHHDDGAPGDSVAGDPGDPVPGDPVVGDPVPGDPVGGDSLQGDPTPGDPLLPPQSIQLNLDPATHADVSVFRISPDGTRAVYLSDEETNDEWELYSVNLDGSGRVRINAAGASGVDVTEFAIAPDSQKIVFRADADTNDRYELYATNIDGSGAPVKLHPALAGDQRTIAEWAITSNGWVVLRADLSANDDFELFATRLDGTDHRTISGAMVSGGDVSDFVLSPDRSLVAYRADENVNNRTILFAVQPDGTNLVRVHEVLASTRDVFDYYAVSADNTRVAFLADIARENIHEIYTCALDSTAVRVNGALGTTGAVARSFRWTPDGTRVVYQADHDTDGVWELFSVLADGTGLTKLHPALSAGQGTGTFEFLPNSNKLLFIADVDRPGAFELYSVDADGTGLVKLNTDLAAGQNVVRFVATPDGSRVVYLANQDSATQLELWAVSPDGTGGTKLTNFASHASVYNFRVSPDSARVVFSADGNHDGVIELYAVGLDGSNLVRLNDGLGIGSDVTDFRVSGDNVIYLADQDTTGDHELYVKSGLDSPGGGITQSSSADALVDDGLVARYYLDEAASGSVPTEAIDAAASPLHVPIDYGTESNMSYFTGPGGRGLQWQRVDLPGAPTRNVDGTKLRSTLEGGTSGTIEVVVDIDAATRSPARFVYFGFEGVWRAFALAFDGPRNQVRFWYDRNYSSHSLWWQADELAGSGRHLLTLSVDTTNSVAMNRVTLYVDGVKRPGFRETINATPDQNATVSLNADHDSNGTTPNVVYDFYIGNREVGERSNDGRIQYVGIYSATLTQAQVQQNAKVLLHDDDTP